jgi:hypothetical protein
MCVLRLYGRRIEERGGGNGVHAEAENVERGKVDCKADRRLARVVGYGLWVETARLEDT